MATDYRKVFAIKKSNEERIKKHFPKLTKGSGIYIMIRHDDDGFKYAYIGQAVNLFDRIVSHLSGYQHIDISLKKHGLYSKENPTGWNIFQATCPIDNLDDIEQQYIREYHKKGYQLHNKTSGSQSKGKKQIAEFKAKKGYHDGLKQGEENSKKFVKNLFEKHLNYSCKNDNNKNHQKAFEKLSEWLKSRE